MSITARVAAVGAVAGVLMAAGPVLASLSVGDKRTEQMLCGETSHFRVSDGAGGFVPMVTSSSFESEVTLTYLGKTSKGLQHWGDRAERSSGGGVKNNPLYHGGSPGGSNPLSSSRFIQVRPINDPPVGDSSLALFVVDTSDPASDGLSDVWANTFVRVQFLDEKLVVQASYISEGPLDLVGDERGSALSPGDHYFSHPRGPRPTSARMVAEGPGRGSASLPEIWLDEMTFSTSIIPGPGVGVLAGAGLVMAGRRRR